MRELLQQASIHIRAWHKKYDEFQPQWLPPAKDVELLEAIDEALSRSKWVKVADGLPVVPEGEQRVAVWVCCSNEVLPEMFWSSDGKWWGFEKYGFTHWQYRQDDTPAPPEAS